MHHTTLSRRQATLFFNDAPAALTHCRHSFNPVQAALIAPHVTLCREDEVVDWTAFEKRVASLMPLTLKMEFGKPIRSDNSVWLPVNHGADDFAALRRLLLSDTTADPSPMNPHATVIHPRNGICTDEVFAEISRLLQPFAWTFTEISLIEQCDGGPWSTLARYC